MDFLIKELREHIIKLDDKYGDYREAEIVINSILAKLDNIEKNKQVMTKEDDEYLDRSDI